MTNAAIETGGPDIYQEMGADSDLFQIEERPEGMDVCSLFSRAFGRAAGRLERGEHVGFLENWLTDVLDQYGDYGMHDEDRLVKEILRLFTMRYADDFACDFGDQEQVAAERRLLDEEFPNASNHYRGRYWRLFVKLLRLYLEEREKGTNFINVEGWMFQTYDEMMETMSDDEVPEVLICGISASNTEVSEIRRVRPSDKDGGRIVKGVMSYITKMGWFGKQYTKRSDVEG